MDVSRALAEEGRYRHHGIVSDRSWHGLLGTAPCRVILSCQQVMDLEDQVKQLSESLAMYNPNARKKGAVGELLPRAPEKFSFIQVVPYARE